MAAGAFMRLLSLIAFTACITFHTVSGNRSPVWDDQSLQVLKDGIAEDTPIGTTLGKLKCTDPDGDSVQYSKRKGNAVSVARDGTMRLAVELDFEDKDSIGYDLGFECFDLDPFTGLARPPAIYEIELTVNDANDIAPEFAVDSLEGYSFSVSEKSSPGYQLTPEIQITDGDRTVNAELSELYIICNSKNATEIALQPETSKATCTKFELNYVQVAEGEYRANLSLKSTLDFETRRVYSSKLVAIDNPTNTALRLSTTINIQINVGDAQDIDPLFVNLGTSTVVSEGARKGDPVNMFIAARDGDLGDRRPVTITMEKDPLNAFTIDKAVEDVNEPGVYNARLRINNPLDREAIVGNYEFTVKVTELDKVTGALTSDTATATYAVQVSDIDDQPPLFGQSIYTVNVTEIEFTTNLVQLTGLRISCVDLDEPNNARFKLNIVSQPYPDGYSISGEVYTRSAIAFLRISNSKYLNYDVPEYRSQTVVLEAVSTGNNPLSSTTTISIQLLDINDNKPIFEQPSYEFFVDENIKIPHDIAKIKAVDGDSGSNGEIRYRLEGGTSNRFEISPVTGQLTLIGAVDYEQTPLYFFLVFAEDQNPDPQISQVQVTVRINNLNDIKPEFEQNIYQTSVNEDDTNFLTPVDINAIDTEEGTGQITYRIIKGQTAQNSFNLNANTGSLTLTQTLPYGVDGKYELEVEASDNGSPSANTNTVKVIVNVIDQNNFSPVLNPDRYTKTLSEIVAPGTFVANIRGTDQDGGDFGTISYRISKGGFDNFRIDASSGVVTVNDPQSFDWNQQKVYNVEIIGSDGGAPQLSATATLVVDITDANNKAPKFTETIYIATVDENRPVNYVIESVSATDPDGSKDLFYSIQPGTIAARNGAGSLLTNTRNYNYIEALGVNGVTGDVYIKNRLDKERALEFSFIVQVQDRNNQTANQIDTTRVTITVTGKANTDIRFDRIEPAIVNEGSEKGYEITTVVARDPTNSLGIKNYQQVTSSLFFEVTQSTGQVKLKNPIDYEKDPHNHNIIIKAIAEDGIRSATATVNIKIIDDNDNAPVFVFQNGKTEYTANLDEDAPSLTQIVNIFATDVDTASYGNIEYRIGGGIDSENFVLYKAVRGVDVLLAKTAKLNYNERDYYELDIIAVDNPQKLFSNVQQNSNVKLRINIIDKNNHAPQFVEDDAVRRMAVAETVSSGTSVGTIVATDDDFGVNGDISFFLRPTGQTDAERRNSQTGVQLFTIVQKAGIIIVAADSLVGYGGSVFNVEVFAQDGGSPYLTNSKVVVIEVLSTENNDGNPVWHSPANNFIFSAEEETPGYILNINGDKNIFSVDARKGDSILYRLSELTPNYKSFLVNESTGVVTIIASLDREVKETYNLLIYAEDEKDRDNVRTGRQFYIQLKDKNDNQPTFVNPKGYPQCGKAISRPVDVFINENVVGNKNIYRVSACDPDKDRNSIIYYYPYNGNTQCVAANEKASPYVRVEENGYIVTKKTIDYEEIQSFTMCVEARANKVTSSTRRKRDIANLPGNVAHIAFHVRDENDNGPEFEQDHLVGVLLTVPGEYPVLVLNAIDKDGVGFNVPVYTIIDSKFYAEGATTPTNPGKAFIMINNELHANPPRGHTFQEFAKGRFELLIKATDPVKDDVFDTQKVTVYVYISTQAMKVTLGKVPESGIDLADDIVRELNKIGSTSNSFHYLHASVHKKKDGYDDTKTDICFIVVDSGGDIILDTFNFISLLGETKYKNVLDNANFDIENVAKCYPTTSSEDKMKWKDLWWVLVVVAIFLGVFAIFCIVIIFAMHRRYRRYMETEKTYLVPQ